MKNYIITIFILFWCIITVQAQQVKDLSKTMSLGPQHAYYIEIKDVSKKIIEEEWTKYLKDNFKNVKYNKKAKENYTEKGSVPMINSTNPLTIYSKIEEGRDLITLYVWADTGNGFVNPESLTSQSDGMRRYLGDFWIRAKRKAVTIELEKEEDKKKDLEKDFSKLEKRNKELHSDIEKFKEKIRQAEADIEQNLKDQDAKKVEIKNQDKVIQTVVERLNNVGKVY